MHFLRRKRYSLSLDMAPLIDIVFLLLIFFMLSSSFLRPAIKLDLPKAIQQEDVKRENLIVSVDTDQNIFVNTLESSMRTLEQDIASQLERTEKKSVHLQGDKEIPYGLFVQIMNKARLAGANQINIVHDEL